MSLSNNSLTDLPTEMQSLRNLQAFSYEGNPFTVFPTALCYMDFFKEMNIPYLYIYITE